MAEYIDVLKILLHGGADSLADLKFYWSNRPHGTSFLMA